MYHNWMRKTPTIAYFCERLGCGLIVNGSLASPAAC